MFAILAKMLVTEVLLPQSVKVIKKYVASTDTKSDDKVLDIVQIGASYLAPKANNTISENLAESLLTDSMRNTQG